EFPGGWQIATQSERLLANRLGDEGLVAAVLRIGGASFAVHLCRALEGRRDVDTVAAREAFRLAQRKRRDLAIRCTVRCNRAELVAGYDVGRGEAGDRTSRIGHALGELARRIGGRAKRFTRALHAGA